MKKLKIKKINLRKLKSSLKDKPIVFSAIIVVLFCVGIIFGGTTLLSKLLSYGDMLNTGYNEEVKSISFQSDGWDSSDPGSVKVTKSASWTDEYEATIDIVFDSKDISYEDNDRNIILVLDTSVSMTEERVKSVNESIIGLLDVMFDNTNNKLALISFDSESIIQTGFTNNRNVIEEKLNSLVSSGATNYYLALKDVEKLMDDSNVDDSNTHLIFITDGIPTEGKTMHAKQAQIIKNKYPNMLVTAIQFEMTDEIANPIIEISDYQYYSFGDTIDDVLLDAYKTSSYFENIVLTDYIHDEYFYVESVDDIKVTHGSVKLENEGTKQKVIWNVSEGKVKSGTVVDVSMSIKAKIREEYRDDYGYLPTNRSTSVVAKADGIEDVTTSTNETPVLKSWVDVIYDSNLPTGCSITYNKIGRFFPFTNVTIDGDNLTCAGYLFKGWQVVEADVRLLGDELFELPGHDVTIGAEWTKLNVAKSMEGEVYEEPTFYNYLKANATMDNIDSEYVVDYMVGPSEDDPERGLLADVGTGINYFYQSSIYNGRGLYMASVTSDDKYPTLVFRGNINNNNVLFANKCWKAVMTTKNGGIKLIYNGVPTNGTCSASGTAATIGTSAYNAFGSTGTSSPDTSSLADAGYVYGDRYLYNVNYMGEDYWPSAVGINIKRLTLSSYTSRNIYYSSSYRTYTTSSSQANCPNTNTFQIGSSYGQSTNYNNWIGKYTVFGTSSQNSFLCSGIIYYVLGVDTTNDDLYVAEFTRNHASTASGQDMATYYKNIAKTKDWYYANDVTYENGVYKLQNPVALKPVNHGDALTTIDGDTKLHYTCMANGTTSCSTVAYVFWDTEGDTDDPVMTIRYVELTGGTKMEDAVDAMIGNPTDVNDSDIKTYVDNWYVNNLQSYESMLETSEFEACNNREVLNYGGWHKDGGFTNKLEFQFKMSSSANTTSDKQNVLSCRAQDVMSVANGKLDYPIALLSSKEAQLAGATSWYYDEFLESSNYLYSGTDYWVLGGYADYRWRAVPGKLNYYSTTIRVDNSNGYKKLGVRPVVALDNSVMATGTGTAADPYVIKAG